MEMFLLIPGVMTLALPYLVVGFLVLCAVLFGGLWLWSRYDDKRHERFIAECQAEHESFEDELRELFPNETLYF